MSVLAAISSGINVDKIFKSLDKVKPVPGRLEPIVNFKNKEGVKLN